MFREEELVIGDVFPAAVFMVGGRPVTWLIVLPVIFVSWLNNSWVMLLILAVLAVLVLLVVMYGLNKRRLFPEDPENFWLVKKDQKIFASGFCEMKLAPEGYTRYTPHKYPRVLNIGIKKTIDSIVWIIRADVHFPKETWGPVPFFKDDPTTRNNRLRETLASLSSEDVNNEALAESLRKEYDFMIPGVRVIVTKHPE
ncbi:MAG: hypothetical protein A3J55_01075 [Candidatus Ryanbacteria bacterium RIFCSPHIGHO2_02_FULL_45_17b]|uniref:Uncharacterized protein n=1 Tax=Candidatus Ryanbacteria bacterium RIFCSPHIGHO2_01_FULL_45_22 TaxID=1802114 RepID=A0A1G2G1N7_9BACT|nr:MAG: hypothetical protein A2719_03545 [Candidatus Ryanbacteria bacterium RIFCSPHIGHO2_01_FULL_45_22]OGZ47129.1 MAG: hypothetical protein A3J55_01075 [Candidatus Ryanbacteria bacterium RIFCSPHIGHO2_02_FULL_45_17b]